MALNHIMKEIKNLRSPLYRNSIYISLASLTTAIAGFLFWAIAARLYPAGDVGVASAIVSAINLTFQLSMLGMNFAVIRFYPEYGERVMGSAVVITSLAGLVFSTTYGFLMMRSGSFQGVFTPLFLATFILFSVIGTLYNLFSTYAIARRKAEHSFIQSILFSSRFLFLLILIPLGSLGIVSAFGAGLALGLVYALLVIGTTFPRIDREFIGDAVKFSLGNYIANIANIAPNYLMPTLVLSMLGKEDAAYFYMAFAIGNLVLFVPNAINTSFFVEGSHGLKDMKKTLKKAIIFSYVYLAVVTLFVWFFGGFVLRFFGEGYVNGLPLLRLMVIGGFFVVVVNFSITILNIQKRVKEIVMINTLKTTTLLSLSYFLISRRGIIGIGISWVVSLIILSLALVTILSRHRLNK